MTPKDFSVCADAHCKTEKQLTIVDPPKADKWMIEGARTQELKTIDD